MANKYLSDLHLGHAHILKMSKRRLLSVTIL